MGEAKVEMRFLREGEEVWGGDSVPACPGSSDSNILHLCTIVPDLRTKILH